MVEAILLHSFVIKPRTITRLPSQAADHTELCAAATRHVIASLFELDGRRAVEAALPAFLFRDLGESRCGFVIGTFPSGMPTPVAGAADLCAATTTFPIFAAAVGTAGGVQVDVGGLDPLAAATSGAVYAVLGGVFLVFLVPFHLEAQIEELLDVFKGNVVVGAAFWRHVLWVGDGEGEDSAEAGMAHAVGAGEFGGFGDGDV